MTTLYRLDFYNTSGALQYWLTGSGAADASGAKSGFLSLAYTKVVNTPGIVYFSIRGDHEMLSSLTDKWQVEVWRKPDGQAWGREITGIYRQPEYSYSDHPIFVGLCPGLMSMLSWRIVNWAAGTTNRTSFTSADAETVMNTLVSYNACANATTGNGRKRDGAITGLTAEADGAEGNTVNWYCAQANLLATLQDLARISGGDFDVVKTSATAWQYRWYLGQLGTDRSASVKFSMELGNMRNPTYRRRQIEEATVACVWGQGEETDRDYVTRTGANYNASTNNVEMYVDARNIAFGDTSGLNSKGDLALDEVEAREEFGFQAIQTPQTRYGVNYVLGDLVTAVNPFTGVEATVKVQMVTVSFDGDGKETVDVGMLET